MVAITEKYRRMVEKRRGRRRSILLPMRVTREGETLFEGASLDVSDSGVYFRMPGGEQMSPGSRVHVEMSIPSDVSGGPLGVHLSRTATVVRIEDGTLAYRVGCHPRSCGVALALDPEVVTLAAAARRHEAAAVA